MCKQVKNKSVDLRNSKMKIKMCKQFKNKSVDLRN